MTEGYKVIKELGRRGLRGYYFSYSQYKELSKIKGLSDVKSKIVEWGFSEVKLANNINEIVDRLKKSTEMTKEEKGCFGFLIAEPLFWLLLGLGGCMN